MRNIAVRVSLHHRAAERYVPGLVLQHFTRTRIPEQADENMQLLGDAVPHAGGERRGGGRSFSGERREGGRAISAANVSCGGRGDGRRALQRRTSWCIRRDDFISRQSFRGMHPLNCAFTA